MKKFRVALSIAVLLTTMTVIGVSNSQAKLLGIDRGGQAIAAPNCDCELENPHEWGIYDSNHQCQTVRCQHDATIE
jgi:hypothetical protein